MALTTPARLEKAFAENGAKNTIPVASQIGIDSGAASYTDGFPPLTRTPIAAGGIPPKGLDMNGVLYDLSAHIQWMNAGGQYPYNADFAAAIGGYPVGARVAKSGLPGSWYNTVDGNTSNPDVGGAGWIDATGIIELPTAPTTKLSNLIYALDRDQILRWKTIGTFTGYASAEVGLFHWGTTDTPRPFEELAIGQTIDGTLPKYQALVAWAIATGRMKTSAAWVAKEFFWADLGGGQYRMPDMRDQFIRATGTDADTANARALGSKQLDALKSHDHGIPNATDGGALGSGNQRLYSLSNVLPTKTGMTGGVETRGVNTALHPVIAL